MCLFDYDFCSAAFCMSRQTGFASDRRAGSHRTRKTIGTAVARSNDSRYHVPRFRSMLSTHGVLSVGAFDFDFDFLFSVKVVRQLFYTSELLNVDFIVYCCPILSAGSSPSSVLRPFLFCCSRPMKQSEAVVSPQNCNPLNVIVCC